MPENALYQLLRKRGLKATRQREEVVRALKEAGTHVTVDELYRRLRKKNPRIGYATVYRTLRLMEDSGWASARRFGERTARFEHRMAGEHHDHLICLGCGTILEFEDLHLEALQERIARRQKFQVLDHKLELYGFCQGCSENRNSPLRPQNRKTKKHG